MPSINSKENDVSNRILPWYREYHRSLPWRNEKDPYRIWISEVMLQQTQVGTVIPYYRRWLKRFPDVRSVAIASLDDALKQWEGLGYYSRCRNFHRACLIIDEKYGGDVPSRWEQFRQLPGVGDYTAAAVLSMAFGKPYPVLDGNVRRVMSRLLAYGGPVVPGEKMFLKKLDDWIDSQSPGEFNQGMMELGNQVCRANRPRCSVCPLTDVCQGYKKGIAGTLPVRPERKPRPHRNIVVGVIWKKGKFLVQKRPEEGFLGGLWELPGGKIENGEPMPAALEREIGEETGLTAKVGKPIGVVDHAYTHFSVTLNGYHCFVLDSSGTEETSDARWIGPDEIDDFAFPRANHKLFALLSEKGWKPE